MVLERLENTDFQSPQALCKRSFLKASAATGAALVIPPDILSKFSPEVRSTASVISHLGIIPDSIAVNDAKEGYGRELSFLTLNTHLPVTDSTQNYPEPLATRITLRYDQSRFGPNVSELINQQTVDHFKTYLKWLRTQQFAIEAGKTGVAIGLAQMGGSRRGFIHGPGTMLKIGGVAAGAVLIAAACAQAESQNLQPTAVLPTLTATFAPNSPPPPNTDGVTPTPEVTVSKDIYRISSIADKVPAFSETLAMQPPIQVNEPDPRYVHAFGNEMISVRRTVDNATQKEVFRFGNPGPTSIQIDSFSQDRVQVGLPFGNVERPVRTYGMQTIIDPQDPATLLYLSKAMNVDSNKLFFAAGSGDKADSEGKLIGGSPLRGHTIMWGVENGKPDQAEKWIFLPWLTQNGISANMVVENGEPYLVYSNGLKAKMSDLLVSIKGNEVVQVSPNGMYEIGPQGGTQDQFKPVATIWRERKVSEDIISIYENLFIPPVLADAWASPKEKQKDPERLQIIPSEMFQIVGAVNKKNHKTLDLALGTLKLAVIDDRVTDDASHKDLRSIIGLEMEQNASLMELLIKTRNNFRKHEDFRFGKGLGDLTFVIEGGIVTMAIYKMGETFRRYKVDKIGNVERMKKEEEPRMRSRLGIENGVLTEDGAPVQLYGAVMPQFQFGSISEDTDAFNPDLDRLRIAGGNFVRIGFNATYLKDTSYAEKLVKAVETAHEQGFRVMLSLSQEGEFIWPTSTDLHVTFDSSEEIKNYWAVLLENPEFSSRLGRCVDIYSLVAEPMKPGIFNHFNWSQWKEIATELVDYVREKIVFSDGTVPICAISGTNWAAKLPDASNILDRPDLVYEIHPYYAATINEGEGSVDGVKQAVIDYRNAGVPVIIGEYAYGYYDINRETEISFNSRLINEIISGLSVPALRYAWISGGDKWMLSPDGKIINNDDNWIASLQGMDY